MSLKDYKALKYRNNLDAGFLPVATISKSSPINKE